MLSPSLLYIFVQKNMKYARLPMADLKDLEKEFIDFLALNGIPASEWERLKKEENEKAEAIIDQFSDVVWEAVLRKIETVEKRSSDSLTICRLQEGKVVTAFVKSKNQKLDLQKDEDIIHLLSDANEYSLSLREDELVLSASEYFFALIRVGYKISDGIHYKELF